MVIIHNVFGLLFLQGKVDFNVDFTLTVLVEFTQSDLTRLFA